MLVSSAFARHALGPSRKTIARATGGTDDIRCAARLGKNVGCPFRVNRVILVIGRLLPGFPLKRTSSGPGAMSHGVNSRHQSGMNAGLWELHFLLHPD
jgi:hypothetical protein